MFDAHRALTTCDLYFVLCLFATPHSSPPMPLRPSILPKLAQCPRYEPAPGCTAATVRGIDMDAAFRAMLHGTQTAWMTTADAEDLAALRWAVDAARSFAQGH